MKNQSPAQYIASPLAVAREWHLAGRKVALATVMETWGSAPRPVGSHLVIDGEGNFEGSVSGGCVEVDVISAALDIITDGKSRTLDFGVSDEVAWQAGLSCGGSIRILVEKITSADQLERVDKGELPVPRLIIIGAVHITKALSVLAPVAGLDVSIIDPRPAFATEARFAGVSVHACWPDEALADIKLDRFCAVAALSHDPKIDDFPLIEALKAECFYVGALGSRKTHARRLGRLREAGMTETLLSRIHAPIGLDIGAVGPEEIAVAIVAEVISVWRGPRS
jgi:xanthine dehydrogenase accessory factor